MKHLIEDGLKIGYSLSGLLSAPTGKGRLVEMIRVNRPNWPYRSCTKAAEYLLGNGIKAHSDFDTASSYLSYLDKQLTLYAEKHPVSPCHDVADPLMLRQWENRWRRARARSNAIAAKTENALTAIEVKEAA